MVKINKMKDFLASTSLLIFATTFILLFISCAENGDEITGNSKLSGLSPQKTQVYADGISQVKVVAIVLDSLDAPLQGAIVQFSTTAGSITSKVYTDQSGRGEAILTSIASALDVAATISAEVSDPEMGRRSSAQIESIETVDETGNSMVSLSKKTSTLSSRAQISVTFVGVTLSAQLDPANLSADGLSQSNMRIWLRETTTNIGIPSAKCRVRAAVLPILLDGSTGSNGNMVLSIPSIAEAKTDTLYVEYGNLIRTTTLLHLLAPRLVITPERTQLLADGVSRISFNAVLVSYKNNPIQNADVQFRCQSGIITASAKTNSNGEALAELRSGTVKQSDVQVIAQFHGWADTAFVSFVDTAPAGISLQAAKELIRDGVSETEIIALVTNQLQKPISGQKVRFTSTVGAIDTMALSDELGFARVIFHADAGEIDIPSLIRARADGKEAQTSIQLLGVTLGLSSIPGTIPADGTATAQIQATLKMTSSNSGLEGQQIQLSTTRGSIQSVVLTDETGVATATYHSSIMEGQAEIVARWGGLTRKIYVNLSPNKPASIQLVAEPNYMWVRETGQPDQCRITARIMSSSGQLMLQEMGVKFKLRNGPNGGESVLPNNGNPIESSIQKSANGIATIICKAGTRSGPVEIEVSLVDYPEVMSRSTQLTVRSGPPYIWIDPADPSHVESHMTVALDYFNIEGWNHVREYVVSVYIGDKYNNPVEEGTTIYLTSTAGIVTTDTRTDAEGRGTAIWTTANPRPTIAPGDPTTLAPHRISNPNSPGNFLPVTLPDFEGSLVRNSSGTLGENDGIGMVMATTHGRDQDGKDAVVFGLNSAVFSGPVIFFGASAAVETLLPGQSTIITVRVYDLNGNPVAKGSSLSASTNVGKLSATDLMANAERYGYGTTFFQTSILNTLDPKTDESKMAEIVFRLDSPNGTGTISVRVFMVGSQ